MALEITLQHEPAHMDKIIEKKGKKIKRILLFSSAGILLIGLAVLAISAGGKSAVRIDKEKVSIGKAEMGNFNEYVMISGNIFPERTIYINAPEGGQIEAIFIENGDTVSFGDPVIRLKNASLQMNYINREAEILEQINVLRNTKINVEEKTLTLREQLLQNEYELSRSEKNYNRNKILYEKEAISLAEFDPIREEYEFLVKRQQLLREKLHQDSLLSKYQLSHIDPSIGLMQKNLSFIESSLDNLTLKAPADGQVSSLNAEVGQSVLPGENVAQVDIWDGFKVRAGVEEFYLGRVFIGQEAVYDMKGKKYTMEVVKIFPEVIGGRFNVDLVFRGEEPEGMRRGQTLTLRLSLGDASEAMIIPTGGYTAMSGGNWVYVLNADGTSATKKNIKTGRQNPEYIEVLSGLNPGDQIITSDYSVFNNAEKIVFR